MDRGNVGKKLDRHIDRHVQHVVDVLPFVFDFERLPIITAPALLLAPFPAPENSYDPVPL